MVAAPRLTAEDLYLFGEGNHHQVHFKLGGHAGSFGGRDGVNFAVWAPNAERVSVVGGFCGWDGNRHVMQGHGRVASMSCSSRALGPARPTSTRSAEWVARVRRRRGTFRAPEGKV